MKKLKVFGGVMYGSITNNTGLNVRVFDQRVIVSAYTKKQAVELFGQGRMSYSHFITYWAETHNKQELEIVGNEVGIWAFTNSNGSLPVDRIK
jgi:hypothetical protein